MLLPGGDLFDPNCESSQVLSGMACDIVRLFWRRGGLPKEKKAEFKNDSALEDNHTKVCLQSGYILSPKKLSIHKYFMKYFGFGLETVQKMDLCTILVFLKIIK